jgi:hypothetical protein
MYMGGAVRWCAVAGGLGCSTTGSSSSRVELLLLLLLPLLLLLGGFELEQQRKRLVEWHIVSPAVRPLTPAAAAGRFELEQDTLQPTTAETLAQSSCSQSRHQNAFSLLLLLRRFELEQERKWVVEWQVGQKELVVNVADPKQSVYIYNCSDCVMQVGGAGAAATGQDMLLASVFDVAEADLRSDWKDLNVCSVPSAQIQT